MQTTFALIISLLFFSHCTNNAGQEQILSNQISLSEFKKEESPIFIPFSRDSIKLILENKIRNHQPLIVHVFVPLCDNEHQGIVPVNSDLGNGFNLKTNLYWGARYGFKSFFLKDNSWKFVASFNKQNDTILERIVFNKLIGGANVYLIADAYRGDRMKNCLRDFMNSIAQINYDSVQINDSIYLKIGSGSDLMIFNGHNGLMDTNLEIVVNQTQIKKDAAVIGCISYNYFYERLNYAGGFPILTTNSFMAPEAYCAEALITAWAQNKSGDEIVEEVANAYATYQKCGMKGARTLFKTGL